MRLNQIPKFKFILLSCFIASYLKAASYSQLVLPFEEKKEYSYELDESGQNLILKIKDTSSTQVESLYSYDDQFIRRLLVKETIAGELIVEINLKNEKSKITIYDFDEPFRIVIDLFHQQAQYTKETQIKPVAQKAVSRKLMQPLPTLEPRLEKIEKNIEDIAKGIGEAWSSYPKYIFRLPIPKQTREISNKNKFIAMADYASELYDYGHEIRALYAYQQLLQQQPQIFTAFPEHLFRMAEAHLGQANLVLAKGYYTTIIEQNPSHILAQYAQMRLLDIALIEARSDNKLPTPTPTELAAIRSGSDNELSAHLQIRQSFWNKENIEKHLSSSEYLPSLSVEQRIELENLRPRVKYIRTAFLVDTLLFEDKIKNPDLWNGMAIEQASNYFQRYGGKASEPFRSRFIQETNNIIREQIKKRVNDDNYQSAIELYNSLPNSLKSIADDQQISWLMAKAHQATRQYKQASKFFEDVSRQADDLELQFKASYWQLENLLAANRNQQTKNLNTSVSLSNELKTIDRKLLTKWSQLDDSQKTTISTEISDSIENNLSEEQLTKIHPTIQLWSWSRQLSTKQVGEEMLSQTSTPRNVRLISKLAKRFSFLGMSAEQRQAKALLRNIQPNKLESDPEATRLWTKELIELAEIFRQNNDYLEAGRTYAQTGADGLDWDGRAEALYKGGLLLYRSGRRNEAVDALTKAANDTNNRLYADLAKQRLEQLQ